ncbi:uncharacterized protein LOC109503785 [Harpegnathos saltator]|uniref:uncharacterized protein LOC109503785 n=1 Tax=Harpegnathos saltator TaxID=610380 RepID=UPI000DBEEE80|nr:uncharacterized protein LOC109503785 [Harpegnathos saltator]
MPLNGSRKPIFNIPFAMEKYIHWEKFVYVLQLYTSLMVFFTISSILATEVLALACMQHTCAMFMITSYRIKRAVNKNQTKLSLSLAKNPNDYKSITEAIDCHQRAIEFNNFFRSISGIIYLILIPLIIISLSINTYYFCRYVLSSNISDGIFCFFILLAYVLYMFFNNFIGQQIIDYSQFVFETICNTRWYATSIYTQKCLLLMMERSMKGSNLIVGGLFVPSFEGFATVKQESIIHGGYVTKSFSILFRRDTCNVSAHQHVAVIFYGDLFHTTVIIVESRDM